MAPERTDTAGRLNAWLNDPVDPSWVRPGPGARQLRQDAVGTALFLMLALGMLVVSKSMGLRIDGEDTWRAFVAMTLMILPLAVRRRFPLTVLLASSALFLGLSYLSPEAAMQITFQAAYFAALYAAVAWAPDRRLLWLANGLVLLTMALWVVITFTMTATFERMTDSYGQPDGPLGQMTAAVLYSVAVNLAFFGGAILVGRSSWRAALQQQRLAAQADRIREQSGELARRAVVDERLRIARELHDVVAHHVAVIGIQAGAARRVLGKNPDAATEALRTIEGSSRDAVAEMRSLLGVLRSETDLAQDGAERAPEPDLAGLRPLVESVSEAGLAVELRRVEERPGDLENVPGPLGLSIYRTVQESLANVARHSTATRALVTLRTGTDRDGSEGPAPRWVEVEVIDDGRPRGGTEGSGFGLRGIRERVALHGGDAEIGPRRTGTGWRVRARFGLRVRDGALVP
ncbi:sensor histidine kinase [Georgenia sp. EYE_87]|uniref:sensor histidine kinase n=1 Tax=Georgenia sp. EYE_87 TaxID=2853448 RepID=UPI0020047229|nr:histidine kinase [Georgenia sp. EYE_87]MCK6211818.1 sensor histidine kinase [Georgenia sp. EYE_87]